MFHGAKVFRALLVVVATVAVLCVLFVLGSYLAPLLTQRYQNARSDIAQSLRGDPDRPGVSGLIYVESPEVYTRQRLVNDRYLQDAWLRERLEEIDDPNAGWIEEAQADMRRAVLSLAAGSAGDSGKKSGDASPEAGAMISDTALKELLKVPFDARFQLQSEARDKIRQLILENALDDRHDLSGNTVFGLKFDTSILPGSEAYLNPTVVVRMEQNPLDRLFNLSRTPAQGDGDARRAPEDFLRHFMRYEQVARENAAADDVHSERRPWRFTGDEIEILEQIDDYFAGWLLSLERRLTEYRGDEERICRDANVQEVRDQLDAPMCERGPDGRPVLGDWASDRIETLFAQVEEVDDALNFITRAPHFGAKTAERLREQVRGNASAACEHGSESTLSLRDFLEREQADIPFTSGGVPGVWGLFLDAKTIFRGAYEPGLCPYDVDMSFGGSSVNLLVTAQQAVEGSGAPLDPAFLAASGLEPLACEPAFCPGFNVWLEQGIEADAALIEEIKNSLTPEALSVIGRTAENVSQRVLCRLEQDGSSFLATGSGRDSLEQLYNELVEPGDPPVTVNECVAGRSLRLRLGAYEFFRRMAEVESYTYAAFPRGDVTGVVREVSEHQSLGLDGGASGVSGSAGFERGSSRRTIEAVPRVINFASGQSRSAQPEAQRRKHFDFGWTVVKEGPKEPMMASQLVLISMPAYMDEISLKVWKGFLDLDKVPSDRSALLPGLEEEFWERIVAGEPVAAAGGPEEGTAPLSQSYEGMAFEDRIQFLMKGYETGTITLKVPPDYTALDSIVIGRSKILGPQINVEALDEAVLPEEEGGQRAECVRWSKVSAEAAEPGAAQDPYYLVDLVVPGERLWRSTVVTLGGAKAQRIEVMPDMRGILASFRLPEEPVPGVERVWVWTSEGRDTALVRVCDEMGHYPQSSGAAPVPRVGGR